MRKPYHLLVVFSIAAPFTLNAEKKDLKLKSDKEKISYAYGQRIGQSLKNQGVDIDVSVFSRAIVDVLNNHSQMNSKEIESAFKTLKEQQDKKMKELAKANLKAENSFLEANKKKAGIVTTKSGLQYKTLKAGKGASPTAESTVKVNYEGQLLDGTIFDSTYHRGEPATFPLKGVIAGWQEALQLMKPGGIMQLHIPSKLAYGETPRPGIPPNSTLNFKVELIEVVGANQKEAKKTNKTKKK